LYFPTHTDIQIIKEYNKNFKSCLYIYTIQSKSPFSMKEKKKVTQIKENNVSLL